MPLLLVVSCNLHEKTTKKHRLPKYDFADIKDYDTTGKSSYYDLENPKPKVVLTEGNTTIIEHYVGSGAGDYYPDLKIVEVNNTKVVKQSKDFSEGRIVYKIPNVMRIRTTYKVLVRISKSKSTVILYDSLSGEVMTSRIPVTETMEVKLIDVSNKGKKSFEIVSDNNSIQIIENGDTYTEWSWNVTPIRVGDTKLKIVVSVIRNDNKKDIVYEDTVKIERDLKEQILFFLEEYWKWLITTFILPFIVWWWKNRKNKKETETDKNKEDGESETV